ncbi:hypothetical protein CVT25_013477, partial [Psilocybe cyanescens]
MPLMSLVTSYLRRAFNVDKLFGRYFDDNSSIVDDFRRMQFETGLIVSGSSALHFLDRTGNKWTPGDLDLYVDHRFRREVCCWLEMHRYNFDPSPRQHSCGTLQEFLENETEAHMYGEVLSGARYTRGLVLNFRKDGVHKGGKIQVITSNGSALSSILGFHSSKGVVRFLLLWPLIFYHESACVMNLITYDAAFSLYPKATFEDRLSLLCLPASPELHVLITTKYGGRGWNIIGQHDLPIIAQQRLTIDLLATLKSYKPETGPELSFYPGRRHLRDLRCWTLPLMKPSTVGFFDFKEPAYKYSAINSWYLGFEVQRCLAVACPRITFELFDHEVVQESLIVSDRVLQHLQELRPHLLVCDDYLSGDRFLRTSCWQKIDRVLSCLHGTPVQYQKRCVVVGLVSRECALLGPSGDFEPGHGSLADARHIFKLTCPQGIPGYEDDFDVALENVADLLEVLPGNKQSDDPFLSTTSNGAACLRFNPPIFQSKALHFLHWVRHRINPRYPVLPEHTSYLSEIVEDYAMSVYTVTKAGEDVQASDIGSVAVLILLSLMGPDSATMVDNKVEMAAKYRVYHRVQCSNDRRTVLDMKDEIQGRSPIHCVMGFLDIPRSLPFIFLDDVSSCARANKWEQEDAILRYIVAPPPFNGPFVRQQLHALPQYVASPSFMNYVQWRGTGSDVLALAGGPTDPIEPAYAIVVGVVVSNRPYLGVQGNFNPAYADPLKTAKAAKLQFEIAKPVLDSDFGPDYDVDYDNLLGLQDKIAKTSLRRFFLIEDGRTMRFNYPLWEPK